MPGNTLSSVFIPKCMAGLKPMGYRPEAVLQECGLDPELLRNPSLNISFWEFSQLSKRITYLLKDETHGLIEVPQSIGTMELIALALIRQDTLAHAIESLADFSNRRQCGLVHSVQKTLTGCIYRVDIEQANGIRNEFAMEATLLYRHRLLCWLCGTRIGVTQLHLPYPTPEWQNEYQYMYPGAAIFFNAPHAGFTFDKAHLANPVVQNEAGLSRQLSTAFSPLPPADIRLGSLAIQVRGRLQEELRTTGEIPDLDATSEMLGFEAHTLRRRLRSEGISYKDLRATVRQELAMKLLGRRDMSIDDVASSVGYAELSSFSRAFKAWTGVTPLKFRDAI